MLFSLPRPGVSLLALAAALALHAGSAAAQDTTRGVRIGLVYTPGTKPGVLVLPAGGATGDSVRSIIQRDFDYGDRISVVAPDSTATYLVADGTRSEFNYPLFARLGALAVVQPKVTGSGLHIAVHNVAQQKVERTKDFMLDGAPFSPEWRLSLHVVSDEIEQWITGVAGISATRIAYADTKAGHIYETDSDGANARIIASAPYAMSPNWHPRGTHIAYSTLSDEGSQILIREMGGATRVLPTPRGLNATPVFSPDGATILYAHGGDNGTTDLYATSAFASQPARRVTVSRVGSNISPTFSPDGRRIAFTSGRAGSTQIYISDADGTNAEILTRFNFGDQSYRSNPRWSPDGRLIAFQAQIDGVFQIMTINLSDLTIRRLTSDGINEMPSWAPDSRHIVFSSNRTGSRQLFVIDIESGRLRQLTHGAADSKSPGWSPSLRSR